MHDDEPTARAFNEEAMALYNELGLEGPFDNSLLGLAICANMRCAPAHSAGGVASVPSGGRRGRG
jgi:hypothetical protein